MNLIECKCWYILSLLSLPAALITFSMSQFMEIQFGNSKLVFSIVIVIMAVAFTTFVHKTACFRSIMILTNNHRFRWVIKAVVEFFILAFVTMLIVLMKYPRFRNPDDKQEYRTISAIRAYCQNPNFPDPQIKDICSNLPKEKKSEHGDRVGFFSAAAFSLHIFSTSLLLNLPEEYGLFYMCLELTVNAAVEIKGIGGSILNWYYVGPAALYCFGLIIVRCYYHSSNEVRRRGRNGGDHDDDDNDGDDRDRRPRLVVTDQQAREVAVEFPGMRNQLGDCDDGAGVGGGVGEQQTGDQGRRTDLGSAGSDWEILAAKECDEHMAERDEGTCDQGQSAGSGREIVSAEEADEHEAGTAEGFSSKPHFDLFDDDFDDDSDDHKRFLRTCRRVFRRHQKEKRSFPGRKLVELSDQKKFAAIKADPISDKKSV